MALSNVSRKKIEPESLKKTYIKMSTFLTGIASEVIATLVPLLSDHIRDLFIELTNQLEEAAEKTENEFDDALVEILRAAIDAPEPKKKGDVNEN